MVREHGAVRSENHEKNQTKSSDHGRDQLCIYWHCRFFSYPVGRSAHAYPTPSPTPFDQTTALAKLREQIKGKETQPAASVFKNIQILKNVPAGRLLSIMEIGYARSLGVNCTHCHVPDKWESEEKPQKQIARDMVAMMGRINGELLEGIKNLKSDTPTVNCTTCHRGEIKPALNLQPRPSA